MTSASCRHFWEPRHGQTRSQTPLHARSDEPLMAGHSRSIRKLLVNLLTTSNQSVSGLLVVRTVTANYSEKRLFQKMTELMQDNCRYGRIGIVLMFVVCVFARTVCAQVTSQTLRDTFGRPRTTSGGETFLAAPDIHLTATYDEIGRACVLVFTPDHTTKYGQWSEMDRRLKELAEKAVPTPVRGKWLSDSVDIDGCSGEKSVQYEHVVVRETIFAPINPTCETEMKLEIRFNQTDVFPRSCWQIPLPLVTGPWQDCW